ncbi:hypothetical protein H3Z85_02715 [Chryseobacterium indologenes]|nr:hypothetical protein H3Z85_02715 [Chryseobacterium indologenes]
MVGGVSPAPLVNVNAVAVVLLLITLIIRPISAGVFVREGSVIATPVVALVTITLSVD